MANQLAQQMLNNLAVKAGHKHSQDSGKQSNANAPVKVSSSEEQMLMNLIHLKETLYPEKTEDKAGKQYKNQTTSHKSLSGGMISLKELAEKSR